MFKKGSRVGRKENTISRDDAKHRSIRRDDAKRRSISRGNVNVSSISRGNEVTCMTISRNATRNATKELQYSLTYQKNKTIFKLTRTYRNIFNIRETSMEQVLERFVADSPKIIECGQGWFPLILSIHEELIKIEPRYQILQVKQKFGGLCFYYVSNSNKHSEIDRIVKYYEDKSFTVCEETGRPGRLMRRNGVYKTLHSSFYDRGWNPI